MHLARVLLYGCLIALTVALLFWLARSPQAPAPVTPPVASATDGQPAFRIAIVPERDIFAQRERYQALGDYLAHEIGLPVEILTAVSYGQVIEDLAGRRVEAAFLGSLATVLASDRVGAFPVARPVYPDGQERYCSVIFVPEASAIASMQDLAGRRLAMVRTTFAGHLFPVAALLKLGMWNTPQGPQPAWVGTHDEVISDVAAGRVDAGAVKNLRLEAFEREHPQVKLRRLLSSELVPENSLVLPGATAPDRVAALRRALMSMHEDDAGQRVLGQFGAVRFSPCAIEDYSALYDVVEQIGADWPDAQLQGTPPVRPAATGP